MLQPSCKLSSGEMMKFSRPKGFIGSKPRNWIDKNLPKCPFCKEKPTWEWALEMKLAIAYNRYHFRCQNCLAILSVPTPIIMGFIAGFHHLIADKKVKIESIGMNSDLENLVGDEYSLEILNQFAQNR